MARRGDIEDIYPLCELQEGMLYHSEVAPASPAYWNQLAFTIEGQLNLSVLRGAWQIMVDRHAVYRTAVSRDRKGRPMQVVRRSAEPVIRFEDWRHATNPVEQLHQLGETLLATKPNLTSPPLFNICVVQLTDERHRMIWTVHHMIQDGWSSARVLEELFVAYAALQAGEVPELPAPVPYRRYIERQQAADVEGQRMFWSRYLEQAKPLHLAGGAKCDSTAFKTLSGALERVGTQSLLSFARSNGVTMSSIVQTAWALTLAAETGQADVLFGVTASDRPPDLQGADQIVGLMLKTLPVRLDTTSQDSIGKWIHAHQLSFADLAGTNASLAEIQRWAGCEARGLFDTLLVFENYPLSDNPGAPAGLTIGEFTGTEHTNYPVTLMVQPGQTLRLALSVDTAQIEEERAVRILERLQSLLQRLPDFSGTPAGQIDWLLPEERLSDWPPSPAPAAHNDPPAVQMIERWVNEAPAAVAVVFEDVSQTYAELWQLSADVARGLLALGVREGDLVGVCLERSLELPALLIGIWRAGAGYVPLDPAFPALRLADMVADAQPRLVVTADPEAEFGCPAHTLAELRNTAQHATHELQPPVLEAVAYVIYTSGSTGVPKGVVIEHQSVSNFLLGMLELLRPDPEDRLLAITTISFDIAVLELFLPLVAGAATQILPSGLSRDGEAIAARLKTATILQATPSSWQLLIDSGWQETDPERLLALCGGEALPAALANAISARARRLWNLYGPTETTVWSTAACVDDPADIVIGRPIRGTACVVADEIGRPLPPGVYGELLIGGRGVSPGYLHREALSRERFFKHATSRVFRTGDVAALDARGRLVCAGRNDRQIKIRGFRVELDEIEAVLMRHDQVGRAAVVAHHSGSGSVTLIAFCEARGSIDENEIRNRAADWLPAYMVPARVEVVAALPLTPNLKVDRGELAKLVQPQPQRDGSVVPETELELAIAAQWTDLLDLPRIGIHDDFFAVGGDSLKFARLFRRLRDLQAVVPPLSELYAAPTIAEQASLLQRGGDALPELTRSAKRSSFPASPFQQRLWMLEQFEAAAGAHNVLAAFRTDGDLDETRLRLALDQVTSRHEILRTTFALRNDRVEQLISEVIDVDFAVVELLAGDDSVVLETIAEQTFSLDERPPWKVRLLRGRGRAILAGCFHHSVFDGSSAGFWIDELMAEYAEPKTATPAPVQYGDYATWLKALPDDYVKPQAEFWREALAGALPVLDLPHFQRRPTFQSFQGASIEDTLDIPLIDALTRVAAEHRTSLNVILLAGYVALLRRYSQASELVIGTVVNTRPAAGIDQAIGPYVNTLPLRVLLPEGCTIEQLILVVRDTQAAALGHQLHPFEDMLESLDVPRDLSRTPIYQTLFSVQRERLPQQHSQTPKLTPLYAPSTRARTDISCFIASGEKNSDALAVKFEYASEVYPEWLMRQMLGHLVRIYRLIARGSATDLIDRLELLDAQEVRRLTHESQPQFQTSAATSIFDLIDWQASASRVAVSDQRNTYTYADVAAMSDRVAGNLQQAGVRPGDCIAISVPRSADLVLLVLGIWKAGACYVPIEPDLPEARRHFILEDAGVRFLVSEDTGDLQVAQLLEPAALAGPACPGDLAYLIYTSGSTGQPKGVLVGHMQVANLLQAMSQRPGLSASDRVLACTTLSFDISVLELFLPLSVGAAVHVATAAVTQDPRALAGALTQHRVTTLQATPSAWRLLVQSGWTGDGTLRAFVGGEALSDDLAEALVVRCGEVWNLYGPTETTVWSTCARIVSGSAVFIGQPIRNTRTYVVDVYDQPVPDGVPGQLLIAGDGVAQGYWRRPDLDSVKFTTDPFHQGRVFRTGDIVRRRPGGDIEFVGRADNQVKLRGHRIELDEVAAVARQAQGVENACAVIREVLSDDHRLVVYVQNDDPASFSELDLLKHMRSQLPSYMVPQQFLVLRELPRNASGKLDVSALPQPKSTTKTYLPPETVEEERVAAIWSELLGVPRVGRTDRFFDLGGHSMLAMHAVLKMEEEFGVALSPNHLVMEDLAGVAAAIVPQRRPAASERVKNAFKRLLRS